MLLVVWIIVSMEAMVLWKIVWRYETKNTSSSLNKDYTPIRTRSFGKVSSLCTNLYHLISVSDFPTYRQPHTI